MDSTYFFDLDPERFSNSLGVSHFSPNSMHFPILPETNLVVSIVANNPLHITLTIGVILGLEYSRATFGVDTGDVSEVGSGNILGVDSGDVSGVVRGDVFVFGIGDTARVGTRETLGVGSGDVLGIGRGDVFVFGTGDVDRVCTGDFSGVV